MYTLKFREMHFKECTEAVSKMGKNIKTTKDLKMRLRSKIIFRNSLEIFELKSWTAAIIIYHIIKSRFMAYIK